MIFFMNVEEMMKKIIKSDKSNDVLFIDRETIKKNWPVSSEKGISQNRKIPGAQ